MPNPRRICRLCSHRSRRCHLILVNVQLCARCDDLLRRHYLSEASDRPNLSPDLGTPQDRPNLSPDLGTAQERKEP